MVPPVGPVVRLVQAALVAATAAFVVSTLPGARSTPGFNRTFDGWVQLTAYSVAAGLGILRAARPGRDRLLWVLVAAALGARALGFLLYVGIVRTLEPIPYPSIADAAWLVSALLVIGALVVAVQKRAADASARLALDGVIVALTIAAFTGALLFETLVILSQQGRPSVIAVNLAYPLVDVVIVVVGCGLLISYNWAAPLSLWALVAGAVGISAVDCWFLYQVAAGTFRPGTMLPAISLLATATVGWSGWLVDRGDERRTRNELPRLIVPLGFALACLGLLIYGTRRPIALWAVVFAASAIIVALARSGFSYQIVRATAHHQRQALEAERRFRAVVDASPDAILGVDASGRLVFANDRASVVLGVPNESLDGALVDDVIRPALSDPCRQLLDQEPGAAVPVEWLTRTAETTRRTDSSIPLEIRLNAVVDVSGARIVLVTARDISDRVALEAERQRRAQEAEDALTARLTSLGQLAAGVVHDFNNVLAVILSYAELAGRRAFVSETEADVAVIRDAAKQGVALTEQLLVFARQQPTNPEAVDVNALVQTVLRMVAPTLSRDLEILVEQPDGPVDVVVDRHQVERVLLNLVINARDAMPGGGRLMIRTERGDDQAVVTVADTGHGMSPEVRDRAFEPFFTTKLHGNGNGLGLATAYGIVVHHGGTLNITSEPDAGTVVTMTLPCSKGSARAGARHGFDEA